MNLVAFFDWKLLTDVNMIKLFLILALGHPNKQIEFGQNLID